jgi:hypothetical protein
MEIGDADTLGDRLMSPSQKGTAGKDRRRGIPNRENGDKTYGAAHCPSDVVEVVTIARKRSQLGR